MSCKLCFSIDKIAFRLSSEEGINKNAKLILHTHFGFCFTVEHLNDAVCFSCWHRAKDFHDFYRQVKSLHDTRRPEIDAWPDVDVRSNTSDPGSSNRNEYTVASSKSVAAWREVVVKSEQIHQEDPIQIKLKRGRGRPRKYPLVNQSIDITPQAAHNELMPVDIPEIGIELKQIHQEDETEMKLSRGRGRPRKYSAVNQGIDIVPQSTHNELMSVGTQETGLKFEEIRQEATKVEMKRGRGRRKKYPEVNRSIVIPPQSKLNVLMAVEIPVNELDLAQINLKRGRGRPRTIKYPPVNPSIDIVPQATLNELMPVEIPKNGLLLDTSITQKEADLEMDRRQSREHTAVNTQAIKNELESDERNDEVEHQSKTTKKKRKRNYVLTPQQQIKLAEKRKLKANPHRCEICQIWLCNARKFYQHNKATHQLLEHRCTALKCFESYATPGELQEHMSKRHSKEKCPICQTETVSVEKHMLQMHKNRHNIFVCEICGYISKHKIEYEAHYESKHSDIIYECDICGHKCKSKFLISVHMRKWHRNKSAVESQQCQICGKILKNRLSLIQHQIVHNPEAKTRYKCTYCNRGFPSKYRLKEHSATHTGHRALECSLCHETFRFSSHLSMHRKKCIRRRIAESGCAMNP